MTDKVPCRVQIWQDGTKIEVRGCLRNFTASTDVIETTTDFGRKTYTPIDREYSLAMLGAPWKFERGKPR